MHSPFADLLHTNYIPTDAEIAQIRGEIASHALEIDNIDEQIRVLSARRAELCAHVDAHKALISLSRQLPRDILEQIFLPCLPDDKNAAIDTTEAPLVLGHICSAWRAISLTTPRLWASLHVPLTFVAAQRNRTHILAEWLDRSSSHPLSLSIVGNREPGWGLPVEFTPAYAASALDTLLKHSHRWEHLQLTRLPPSMSKLFLEADGPMLRTIEMDESTEFLGSLAEGGSDEDPADATTLKLLGSTRLCGLFLQHFDSSIWQLPVHWKGITQLDIGRADRLNGGLTISFFDAYELLANCPRLQHLHFEPKHASLVPVPDLPPFPRESLPYLHTLFINGERDENWELEPFWDAMPPMPQLEQFSLGRSGFPTPSQDPNSIIRRMPRLKWLATIAPDKEQGLEFLNLLPSVTYIRLRAYDAEPGSPFGLELYWLFQLLTPSMSVHGQDRLCTALEELVIASCGITSPSTVRDFIDGHIQSQTALRRLTVDFLDEDQEPILSDEEKAAAKAAGLDIEFTFPPTDKHAKGNIGRRVLSFV